ncbi:TonB-dependent siderophore receptor [Vibrio cincinnatiensis]|uniref:TonB-dependent siderophore receptor n=1 Tax=Vibrio cincinnatiensis TaxID=675 RepID=UPI001EDDBF0F|nr:TonB-dependent siderophore receptor [Vibrio cincinnatiensis]MCG3725499.1 TonB-dependent siderophore receptor [Vibrio cincinnatiensis]
MEFNKPISYSPIALAMLACFITPAAFAQEAVSAELETVTILGQTYRNTATKTVLEPEETPQGITVLDGIELEQRGVTSLGQALRYAPGVVTETKGGAVTMYDNYYIRGFQVDQSYYDGLLLQYLKGWNLQPQIDPIAMQQVEIFKGPTSVLYGSMPPGGMVNVIAKSPQKTRHTEVTASTGSRHLKQVTLDTTGAIKEGQAAYRIIAKARKQDGQVDGTEEERYLIAPSLDWQINDKTLLNLNLYYQNDPAMGMNSALPASGMVTSNANGSTSPSTHAGDVNWSQFEREVLMLGYKVQHQLTEQWRVLQNLRYTDASLTQKNTYHLASGFNETSGELSRHIYSTDEDYTGLVIDNQLSGVIPWGSVEHNLLFGLDYQRLKGDSEYKEYATTNAGFYQFNLFNPNNNLLDSSSLSQVYLAKNNISIKQLGAYFQDQARWNRWVWIAGARYDHYESRSQYVDALTTTKANHHEVSYRVGALYQFDSGFAPFINFATSFSPVAGKDSKFDQPFKPEVGEQTEVGVKYQSADMSQQATASLYRIEKKNVVVTDPASANYQDDIQVGKVRSQGVELQARWWILPNWDIAAGYTYADVEVSKDSANGLEGTTPIYVPKHSATLRSTYRQEQGVLSGSRISAGTRYVGEMFRDATNTQGKVPSYTVVDLSLGYDLGQLSDNLQGASVDVMANNLFNKEYYSCYNNVNCWYGAERSIELKVGYQF